MPHFEVHCRPPAVFLPQYSTTTGSAFLLQAQRWLLSQFYATLTPTAWAEELRQSGEDLQKYPLNHGIFEEEKKHSLIV